MNAHDIGLETYFVPTKAFSCHAPPSCAGCAGVHLVQSSLSTVSFAMLLVRCLVPPFGEYALHLVHVNVPTKLCRNWCSSSPCPANCDALQLHLNSCPGSSLVLASPRHECSFVPQHIATPSSCSSLSAPNESVAESEYCQEPVTVMSIDRSRRFSKASETSCSTTNSTFCALQQAQFGAALEWLLLLSHWTVGETRMQSRM